MAKTAALTKRQKEILKDLEDGAVIGGRTHNSWVYYVNKQPESDRITKQLITHDTFLALKNAKMIKMIETPRKHKDIDGLGQTIWVAAKPGEVDKEFQATCQSLLDEMKAGDVPVFQNVNDGYRMKQSRELVPHEVVRHLTQAKLLRVGRDKETQQQILELYSPEQYRKEEEEREQKREANKRKRLDHWQDLVLAALYMERDPKVPNPRLDEALLKIHQESVGMTMLYDDMP